jgi:8-oxo-dGTP pyrophosphatase MutT (NUDIX family)
MIYFSTIEEAVNTQVRPTEEGKKPPRSRSFGTLIYVPSEGSRIDFGVSQWPPVAKKQIVCPRVLLVSTWTDGKFGFVGGASKGTESPLETMNREFEEEIGTDFKFSIDDHCFSIVEKNVPTHIFAHVTDDVNLFTNILSTFHRNQSRKAYVDEVFTATGIPIFVEGPANPADFSWENNIWGLPRYLTFQGGTLTPTLNGDYTPRDQLLLVLLKRNVVSVPLMRRIFGLARVFQRDLLIAHDAVVAKALAAGQQPPLADKAILPTFDEFLSKDGVAAVLRAVLATTEDPNEVIMDCNFASERERIDHQDSMPGAMVRKRRLDSSKSECNDRSIERSDK